MINDEITEDEIDGVIRADVMRIIGEHPGGHSLKAADITAEVMRCHPLPDLPAAVRAAIEADTHDQVCKVLRATFEPKGSAVELRQHADEMQRYLAERKRGGT